MQGRLFGEKSCRVGKREEQNHQFSEYPQFSYAKTINKSQKHYYDVKSRLGALHFDFVVLSEVDFQRFALQLFEKIFSSEFRSCGSGRAKLDPTKTRNLEDKRPSKNFSGSLALKILF